MLYETNTTLADVAKLIRAAGRVLITTHAKPDGDAYGAVAAMTAALRRLRPGAQVEGVLMGPVLPCFKVLRGYPLLREFDAAKPSADADLIIVLDTGAWSQVAPMRAIIEPRLDHTLIIDHHLTGDIAAKHLFVDSKEAACCGVLAEVLDALAGVSPQQAAAAVATAGGSATEPNELLRDPVIAESLFAGIASDTGWFRFSNTNAQTHLLAARLIACGLDQADLYARLEQADRPQKLALQVRAMNNLRFLAGGAVALMTLRRDDFATTGALTEETERFVDLPQSVESVKMVVLVTEPPVDGRGGKTAIRMSVRSKPGPDAVNVAEFAAQFGGGGHARAAGAKVDATFEDVVERVEQAVKLLFP